MTESTESLMERSARGEQDAFRQVVSRHQEYVFALALRILCDSVEAREVVQDTFIRLWSHRSEYRHEVKLTTWIYKITTNLCYDRLRDRRRRGRIFFRSGEVEENAVATTRGNPLELVEHQDLAERIGVLAELLPEKQRLVFTLRDLQDQTMEEVSEILGMSVQSVRTNLCYARAAIRSRLEVKGEE
jgi:RNA polymerase sigma-70 factor (ECF subfamily)